ncbi:MAG: ACP S-malonyltransferase [Flavobacteriales bacterium]|nr:ACP S-malonyltransferase [Flavobacteriales bacterium]
MKAYIFPGQGSQFPGMAKELYEQSNKAQELFEHANEILGFKITDIMFEGSIDDLKETRVTQPAIFIHSVVLARLMGDKFSPSMAAGHSLGEFSALTAAGALSFESGLKLVAQRANAMQKATERTKGTMAAILGLNDEVVENHCENIDGVVVPANYNCPGQLVISGEYKAVEKACKALSEAGARRAMILPVGGAFHSPLMEPARTDLASAIEATAVSTPLCPIYQNVTAQPVTDSATIKLNLIAQLTAPVRWTQTMNNMISKGADQAIEIGPGKVLQGLFKKVDRRFETSSGEL